MILVDKCVVCGKNCMKLCGKWLCSIECRLMNNIEKKNECWIWKGVKHKNSPYINMNCNQYPAHRVSYEIFKQPIGEGFIIDHICDERFCINPDHLRAVNKKEYYSERLKSQQKEKFISTNTTGSMVLDIRYLYDQGISIKDIAHKYGMTSANIRSIVLKKTWKHI